MDLIKFLISYFLEEDDDNETQNPSANVFETLTKNLGSFDLSKLTSILPIFSAFGKQKGSNVTSEPENALLPISNVCDKEILNSLNKYLAEN